MQDYLQLLRPKHWIKSGFVLAPLFFSFQFLSPIKVFASLLAAVSFSLVASSIYIINDILDKKTDLAHPLKKNRPIASGRVTVSTGIVLSLLTFALGVLIATQIAMKAVLILLVYFLVNLSYSYMLKHIVIIDVFAIASGFVLRVAMGAIAIDVAISDWIILITIFLSLFLGFSKRYDELRQGDYVAHRAVLGAYSPTLVLLYIAISAVLTIVIYTFYTIDPIVAVRFYTARLLYSIPVVVFGLFRYLQLVLNEGSGGDVSDVILRDKFILPAIAFWMVLIAWAYRW